MQVKNEQKQMEKNQKWRFYAVALFCVYLFF